MFETVFLIADIIGIFAFAMSGFSVGVKKELDLLGITIAATFTALAGGMIRDVLAQREPFSFVEVYPAITVICAIILSILLQKFYAKDIQSRTFFIVFDAIGLITFSMNGALVGLEGEFNLFGVIMLSFISAIGGGIIRDVMINEVPFVLRSDFYGSMSILYALAIYLFAYFDALNRYTLVAMGIFFLALRLIAYFKAWRLPKI